MDACVTKTVRDIRLPGPPANFNLVMKVALFFSEV